jgi:ribosome-associated translation inhibitor RaiA
MGELIAHIDEPVPFVRVTLALAPDPARARPSMAEATIDIDGDLVRAHVAAVTMREAIDLLQARLRDRIEHRAAHRRSRQRGRGVPEPGEWHRGDLLLHRPEHFDRPSEERELVARKTFAIGEATPDEAAFDMSQLGFDFYLFRDLASGQDALLERLLDGSFRLTTLGPIEAERGPTAIPLTVAPVPPPTATVSDALARLDDTDAPFVFFADADTGRGAVVYRRYDGHYGLITPA